MYRQHIAGVEHKCISLRGKYIRSCTVHKKNETHEEEENGIKWKKTSDVK